eukprot:m.202949 g.202949  ORF g.202949 m.202949 type:complete len:147 (+) comp18445_c0_seq3:86-526(+)
MAVWVVDTSRPRRSTCPFVTEKLRETKALHFEKTPAKEKKTKGSTSSKKRKKEAGDFVVEEESGDDDKFGGDSDGDAPKPAKASKPKQKQKQKRKSKEKSDKAKEKPKYDCVSRLSLCFAHSLVRCPANVLGWLQKATPTTLRQRQ